MGIGSDIWHGVTHPVQTVQGWLGLTQPGAQGVGGARPDLEWALQDVPGTGYQYNPVTGQYYIKGTYGNNVAVNPNLAQQTSGNTGAAQTFLGEHGAINERMAATRAGQNSLGGSLEATIAGRGPSVASQQLRAGQAQISNDQMSVAAGAGGPNAFAARRAAAQNIARASGALNGQLGMVRAQEVADAQKGLAGLFASEASADAAANNTATTAGLGYSGLGVRGAEGIEGINERVNKENTGTLASLYRGAGQALGAM